MDSFGELAVLFVPYGLGLFHLPRAGSQRAFLLLFHGEMVEVEKSKQSQSQNQPNNQPQKRNKTKNQTPLSQKKRQKEKTTGRKKIKTITKKKLQKVKNCSEILSWCHHHGGPKGLLGVLGSQHLEFYVFPEMAFNDGVSTHIDICRGHV